MYRYTEFDQRMVDERVEQYRDQVARYLEDHYRGWLVKAYFWRKASKLHCSPTCDSSTPGTS